MATISAAGIGSGLDVKSLVSQLMAVEQQPLIALNAKKTGITSKISAYGSLSSVLASLKTAATTLNTPSKINAFTAAFSDTTFGTSSATSTATAGTYDIAVTQLAKAHSLASAAKAADTTVIGEGTLTINSGSNSFALTIDSSNSTLAGIRDAVNASTLNTSVNASVITDVNGARLVFSAKNTGLANAITVSSVETIPAAGGLSQLDTANMTQGNPAQNAVMTVNGVSITSASNTVTTAITGVSFTLQKDASSATLTIGRNSSAVSQAASDFAKAFTTLNTTVKNLTAYDVTNKASSVLTGDSTASLVRTSLRNVLSTVPSGLTGTYNSLAQVGISIQSDGSLTVDSTKLQSAIDNHFSDLQATLAAYGNAISTAVTNLTGTNGAVATRVSSLNASIRSIEDQGIRLSARLDNVQARYNRQFSALDGVLSGMTATSNFLTQQLARL